jgi:hypothetical protein
MPNNDTEDPTRAKERNANALPKCAKSNTDTADPTRLMPNKANAEPNNPNDRNDNELPK